MQPLSPKAFRLILDHEVGGGEAYYNAELKRPTWPEGASGVTIGIGYDLGYNTVPQAREDWRELPAATLDRLLPFCGLKGLAAARAVKGVRDIVIPWEIALGVFLARTVPRFQAETLRAFPGADKLPPDACGALTSLVFNRGPALRGKNRQDMLDIHQILADGIQAGDLAAIARQLREMKAIWAGKGLDGLIRRREDEARLVESCA